MPSFRQPMDGKLLMTSEAQTDRNNEILRLHDEGVGYLKLANRFGLSKSRIIEIVKREKQRREKGAE